ncbi:MAG: hypothetical protein Q4D80_05375 [Pseudomonadota bacterium]|nr:hypothetical protein [Pseudomonadota bacterium]
MNTTKIQESEMKNYLYFAGTIYDSFEALEEVLGKLKLERPLFLLYMAKKAYAEEVFAAAGEKSESTEDVMMMPPSQIKLQACRYPQHMQ